MTEPTHIRLDAEQAQQEIETLRSHNKELLEYIDRQDLKNSQQVVDDRDEWKRRAMTMWRWMNCGPPDWDEFLECNPGATKWFEEKDDE